MSQNIRTITFVAVAAASVGAAFLVAHLTAPKPLDQSIEVGQTFFEDFDVNQAGLLELTAIPDGETKPQTFRVEFADGLWRIQTHHGYPAEAHQRLAETAASVIRVQCVALAGRSKFQHERFGVVDPEQKDLGDPKVAGVRIRILDKNKKILVDLIIGKKVEQDALESFQTKKDDANNSKPLHYVRLPDDQTTYLARIELDVSTRFSDWIEPDLLKFQAEDLRKVEIHNYDVRRTLIPIDDRRAIRRAVKANSETLVLSRDQHFDPWKLKGLDEKIESLKTDKITDIVTILDEMKILGVSPRLKRNGHTPLTGDLQFKPPKSAAGDLAAVIRLIRDVGEDLNEKGFSLEFELKDLKDLIDGRMPKNLKAEGAIPAQLLSQNGEFVAATKEGIVYHLHFGSIVEGTDKEIELGGKAKKEPAKKKQAKGKKGEKSKSKKTDTEPSDQTHRRYVLIRVELDRKEMENQPTKPTKPVEPKKPPGYKEPPKKDPKKNDEKKKPAKEQEQEQKPVRALKPGQYPLAVTAGRPNPDAHYRHEQQTYRDDLKQYETDLKRYELDMKEFDKRVEKSKQIIEQLNERFAGWYYVVSTQSLQQLTLTRDKLVGPKSKEKSPLSNFPGLKFPGMR